MTSGVPIVFIHNGNNDYLFPTFYQLKAYNAASEAYLIGDAANKHYEPWIKHVFLKDYMSSARVFGKTFFNLSSMGADYEMFCIQRWFVLRDFMRAKKWDKAIYLDSDVLVYDDLTEQQKRFSSFGMTLCHISGHTNFISKLSVLEEFCDFITELYATEKGHATLQDWLVEFRKNHSTGGISDMTLLRKFRAQYPEKVTDINQIHEGTDFDLSFELGSYIGYEEIKNPLINGKVTKKATWKDGKPYVFNHKADANIRMLTLHFQGYTKPLLFESVNPMGPDYAKNLSKYKLRFNIYRFIRKVKTKLKLA